MSKKLSIVSGNFGESSTYYTYEELIQSHLDSMSDEAKKTRVSALAVIGEGAGGGGPFYSMIEPSNPLNLLGAIEVFKIHMMTVYMEEV